MDEFLYILFLVGWLAFSIYQQNQKKKRKEAARDLANAGAEEPEDGIQVQDDQALYEAEPVEEVNPKPDFRKALEEILLGKQISLETIPQEETQSLDEEAQSLEVIPEKEFVRENKYQDYSKKMADRDIEELEADIVVDEEDTNRKLVQHHFNLRNAIIYTEILRPKYVN
jgi:hypothetical protein